MRYPPSTEEIISITLIHNSNSACHFWIYKGHLLYFLKIIFTLKYPISNFNVQILIFLHNRFTYIYYCNCYNTIDHWINTFFLSTQYICIPQLTFLLSVKIGGSHYVNGWIYIFFWDTTNCIFQKVTFQLIYIC